MGGRRTFRKPFQIKDEQSIDDVIQTFGFDDGKIPEENIPIYRQFLRSHMDTTFSSHAEALEVLLLFSYVVGDRMIYDNENRALRTIEDYDDLRLLAPVNVEHNKVGESQDCMGLFRLHLRSRSVYESRPEDGWKRWVNLVFRSDVAHELFGCRLMYTTDVLRLIPQQHPQRRRVKQSDIQRDYSLLKDYVMGQRPIVDDSSRDARFVETIKSLLLLSPANASLRVEGKYLNHELACLYQRMRSRSRAMGIPNYRETLEKIFSEDGVTARFGIRPSYEAYVSRERQKSSAAPLNRPIHEYIDESAMPYWKAYKESCERAAFDALVEHYTQTLCMTVCRNILSRYPFIRRELNSPEELLPYTTEELMRRIELYDLNRGYEFERFAYHAIRGRVIDQLRTEHVMQRKGAAIEQRAVPIETVPYL